jgi:hypothetical protein
MGQRGASPDPLNYGLYCRKCASKYCICGGAPFPYHDWSDDDWEPDAATPEPESTQPESAESESAESDSWVVAAVVGAVAVVGAIVWSIFG